MAFLDFLLRIAAFGPLLAAAIATGTSDETLSVFTEFYQFRARFDDFPAFLSVLSTHPSSSSSTSLATLRIKLVNGERVLVLIYTCVRVQVSPGGERGGSGIPGAVPAVLRRHRTASSDHHTEVSLARQRHGN
jgi:hypothetical protein